MELLNIIAENPIVFVALLVILLINFGCIIFLVVREKNNDKREIDELLEDLNYRNEVEEVQDKKLEENKKEVEEMLLKMQQDLEARPEDVVSTFENEQEEKSIISYQELLESVKNAKNVNVTPVKIEDEKIEIEDVEEFDNDDTIQIDIPKEEIKTEVKEDEKKFKGTDFISPIFGKQENLIKYPTVPKKSIEANVGKQKENISTKYEQVTSKNDSFLKALKEFRKNLD